MPLVNATCSQDKYRAALIPTGCQIVIRQPGISTLEWFCPRCYSYEASRIEDGKVAELRALGVEVLLMEVPDEATEHHPGPPITRTEIAEFCVELYAREEMPFMPPARRPHLIARGRR